MFDPFSKINVDWMGKRKILIAISIVVLLAGLVSAVSRQAVEGGTDAFNLGVDFQGGTVITAKFRDGKPKDDEIRDALKNVGLNESVIQASTDKNDEVLIKIPLLEEEKKAAEAGTKPSEEPGKEAEANTNSEANTNNGSDTETTSESPDTPTETTGCINTTVEEKGDKADSNQVSQGRKKVNEALLSFGKEAKTGANLAECTEAKYQIIGTDSVGPVAGEKLRTDAIVATLLGMVGILLFIAFRYDWTYAAGAVIAVFHDVLITLAFFTMFQWEVSLTVLAALLTLVGFSVNDSIVIFDRIRENLTKRRSQSLYDLTNDSINQTMSRTIVTNGLVFLAVLALVLFGGEVLSGFSLALFVGSITGTYSTIAIASPIAVWWQSKLGRAKMKEPTVEKDKTLASAARRNVTRRPVSK
jgi:preprotein translocase subunit SecF